MDEQRRILSDVYRLIGMMIVLILLLLAACGGPLPGSPNARTVLPASDVDRVNVLPDGRRILFWPRDATLGLMMLDLSTGERLGISKEIDQAQWLDDDLLYGYRYTPAPVEYYVINLLPLSVVRLEALAANARTVSERIGESDSIYVIVGGSLSDEDLLLLLSRDADYAVLGGYAVYDVPDPDKLLAGHPYKSPPPEHPYDSFTEKYPSPDGMYSYTCGLRIGEGLVIYSQQGDVLNSVTPASSDLTLTCLGWAWNSSGVFFQEWGAGPLIGERRIGPLQLLEVRP